jgi:hypothetical protein
MNDLELEVRAALRRHAGSIDVRSMPPRTGRSVRARQAGFVARIALVAAVGLIAAALVAVSLPHGSRLSPASDGFTSPLEHVPPGWPLVDVHDPRLATVPVVDDPALRSGPQVLVSGEVEGSAFTLVAWTDIAHGRDQACLGFAGLADPGEAVSAGPSTGYCTGERDGVLQGADLALFGLQGSAPGLMANFGFATDRVAEVWAAAGDQGFFQIPTIGGPSGWRATAFLFFPEPGSGSVEAYSEGGFSGGTALSRADVCAVGTVAGTCRPSVDQLFPISSDPPRGLEAPAPTEWPEVTYGGAFTPYVDHEANSAGVVDPGVIGQKVPVLWGTVQGVPWSLTAYDARGDGAGPQGEPGPAGQLFLGSDGAYGGSGLGLYGTTPWQPNDLGLTGLVFGSGPLTAYAGVVSSRVSRVELRLTDGAVRDVRLVAGPAGVDAGYFVVWTPNGTTGEIVALASDGSVVQSARLCAPPSADPDSTIGC